MNKKDPLTFKDAVILAKGCLDYNAGLDGVGLENYHWGINTVIHVLEGAPKRLASDTQTQAVYGIGLESEQTEQEYRQLLLAVDTRAVSKKYAHESIYETALRFIKERVKQEIEDQKYKTVDKNKHPDWRDKLNRQKR